MLQDVPSIWETDVLRPIIASAESLTGRTYGQDGADETDVALRVLADHGRSVTMLIADGVLPSNEGRGYVLRRVIRRAVLTARRLGVESVITPRLAESVVAVLGDAYPELSERLHLVQGVLEREETGFDRTLRTGLVLLNEALDEAKRAGQDELAGETVFRLHDTHGFPVELTEELAGESGLKVDRAGFDAAMAQQRARAHERRARLGWPRRPPTAPSSRPKARPASSDVHRSTTPYRRGSWPCWPGPSRALPRSSSTAHRSTPKAADRSATSARSSLRPGAPR